MAELIIINSAMFKFIYIHAEHICVLVLNQASLLTILSETCKLRISDKFRDVNLFYLSLLVWIVTKGSRCILVVCSLTIGTDRIIFLTSVLEYLRT
jgi:hypothetical protein